MRRWAWISLGVLGVLGLIGIVAGALFLLARGGIFSRVLAAPAPGASPTPAPARTAGLLILEVEPGGPADRAGLVRGDLLLEVDGEPVRSLTDLRAILGRHRPGDTVSVTVQHGDERRTRTVTLGDRNGQAYLGVVIAPEPEGFFPWDGGRFRGWGGLWGRFGPSAPAAWILSVEPNSPAERAGLRAGDWITAVDGQALGPDADLAARIAAHRPGDRIAVTIWRLGEGERVVEVTLGEHPQQPGRAYLGIRYRPWGFHPFRPPTPTPAPTPSGGA
ncbi:hypothetical protein HRbin22_01287 [Candidatus Thermoflexus japonica]|uniref:PDZ domain-containing protein n=1 Tax=Candidatus Thermoflexus japonica TaxID=2035417 RepID=A0A2H5Y6H7_9CHLR|nr:hypothetical protein HRbin22_01287 [Candidatus Thermoflexus japonica]